MEPSAHRLSRTQGQPIPTVPADGKFHPCAGEDSAEGPPRGARGARRARGAPLVVSLSVGCFSCYTHPTYSSRHASFSSVTCTTWLPTEWGCVHDARRASTRPRDSRETMRDRPLSFLASVILVIVTFPNTTLSFSTCCCPADDEKNSRQLPMMRRGTELAHGTELAAMPDVPPAFVNRRRDLKKTRPKRRLRLLQQLLPRSAIIQTLELFDILFLFACSHVIGQRLTHLGISIDSAVPSAIWLSFFLQRTTTQPNPSKTEAGA